MDAGCSLLDKPRETHGERKRNDTTVEEVKPAGGEVRGGGEVGSFVDAESADNISRVGSEGVVEPNDLASTLELLETLDNELLGEICDYVLQPVDTSAGEVRVERLSPLAVKLVGHSGQVGALEVDDTVDETLITVGGADRARDVELVVVVGIANGQLVGVDSYNRA